MAAFSLGLDVAEEVNRHFLENDYDDLSFLGLMHEMHKDPKSGAILRVSQCVSVSVCQCVTLRTRRHVTDL